MSELKNCPFCGGNKLRIFADAIDIEFNTRSVICGDCCAKAPMHNWNTRTDTETKRQAINELLELHEQDRVKVNSQCDTLINMSTIDKYLEGLE